MLVLPFSLPGFRIDAVHTLDGKLLVEATAVRSSVACPDCQQLSARIHSWFMRMPRDLPSSDQFVQLHLHVRRFFCDTPSCARRTFAERLPELVPFRAQRTQRFSRSLEVLGFALSGRAAAHVAAKLGLRTSRNTLRRCVQHAALPARPTPRGLGVDDVAFRKGHTYGTILVDLEQHRPVDLLPDRDADLLITWLQAHPGVEIVSRDRSTEFTRAITSGAPDAIQVADRWHLLVNLREALERVLDRRYSQLRTSVVMPTPQSPSTFPDTAPVLRRRRRTSDEAARIARRERRLARYEEIIARYEQGASMREIADTLHLSRWQVSRFVKASSFPEQAPRRRRARLLTPFAAVLEVRVGQVVLQPPLRPADDSGIWLEPLQVWALWLHEPAPPPGAEAVDWLLLTNVAVTNWAEATERISWYGVRPGIESWHKILKSGCTVEDSRLEAAAKLIPYLTLMGVIAWRLFWLTHINRQAPNAPCTWTWPTMSGKPCTPPFIAPPWCQTHHQPFVRPAT